MTAADLLKRLAINGYTASVIDGELAVEPDAPVGLDPIIGILALPLLALLTGRRLYAIDKAGRGCVRPDGIADPGASSGQRAAAGRRGPDRVGPRFGIRGRVFSDRFAIAPGEKGGGVMFPMPNIFVPTNRWRIEHRRPRCGWKVVGTTGTRAEANKWLARLCSTAEGDWRLKAPPRWGCARG